MWRLLKKNKARTSPTQLARESAFVSRLEDLFDVAHADALTKTSVLQEDKDFLLAQREKGRRGSMAGLDKKLAAKEKRAFEREEQMLARRHQMEQIKAAASTAELNSSGSETCLAAALDCTKVSGRKAAFIIAQTAKSLGQNIDELALNRDSICRNRVQHRGQRASNIKAKIQGNFPLVVHWDGKLIPDLIGKKKVDLVETNSASIGFR